MIRTNILSKGLLLSLLTAGMLSITSESIAQPESADVQLAITGLVNPKKAKVLDLVSAELITITAEQATRQNRTSGGQAYRITRVIDALSDTIRDAVATGKVFPKGALRMKIGGVDGERTYDTQELGRIYLSAYSSNATSGSAATESFLVFFEAISTGGSASD